jgi:hypothetical protein
MSLYPLSGKEESLGYCISWHLLNVLISQELNEIIGFNLIFNIIIHVMLKTIPFTFLVLFRGKQVWTKIYVSSVHWHCTFQSYNISENFQQINYCMTVFPTVNWSWMDIWSSKGVQITGPSIKFTGHSHIPQKRCLDSYWSLGPVMNNLLLGQTNLYWTLQHVRLPYKWKC